jgi:hypothetical protein
MSSTKATVKERRAALLGDFHPFAQNLGAVHCIKKYLARRPA